MFKRFLGIIISITVIAVVVFTAMNRSSYKSMIPTGIEDKSTTRTISEPIHKADTVVTILDSTIVAE